MRTFTTTSKGEMVFQDFLEAYKNVKISSLNNHIIVYTLQKGYIM